MISGVTGKIQRFGASKVYLNVSGLEYEIHVPLNVFEKLHAAGYEKDIHLHIFHQFLNDEQRLFGFIDLNQKELFQVLQNIKGLGSTLTISLLSHIDGATLLDLCERRDIPGLSKIPRVGKATAERLIFEVNRRKDRFQKLVYEYPNDEIEKSDQEEELAFQALLQLGYKEGQIRKSLSALKLASEKREKMTSSDLIKEVLRII